MRFLPIGPRTFLVELADLNETLALFDALNADPIPGVTEIIPAARTLMIRTAPGIAADSRLAAEITARKPAPGTPAVPIEANSAVRIIAAYCSNVRSIPYTCATNRAQTP